MHEPASSAAPKASPTPTPVHSASRPAFTPHQTFDAVASADYQRYEKTAARAAFTPDVAPRNGRTNSRFFRL